MKRMANYTMALCTMAVLIFSIFSLSTMAGPATNAQPADLEASERSASESPDDAKEGLNPCIKSSKANRWLGSFPTCNPEFSCTLYEWYPTNVCVSCSNFCYPDADSCIQDYGLLNCEQILCSAII
jgi:hypothetical protein